jgi:hypothetical protein
MITDLRVYGGKKQIMDNVINIVLDNTYVIREWSSIFRTDYLKLRPLHY